MWKLCNKNILNLIFFISVFSCLNTPDIAFANLSIPRFISIKSNEVNLRSGPANHYPIRFIYKFKNYPLEIIAEFEHWRLVRDKDGDQGWVHQSLLSAARYVVIKNSNTTEKILKSQSLKNQAIIFRLPDETSYPILRVETGAVAKIKKCLEKWCQIEFSKKRGWIQKSNIWGVYDYELLNN